MKLLYGVVGEGMGHAVRSRVVLDHLVASGHEVVIMASGRAHDFLAQRFEGVNRIHGLHMITEENVVHRGKTFWSNLVQGTAGVPRNIAAYFELIDEFRPEMVISDFESWTYLYAKVHRLPIISIDNIQIINRCFHPPEIIQGERANFEIARAFVKSKLPFCDHYLITTFFYPEIRKEKTSLFPPILRDEILSARSEQGDHVLVYQTSEGHERLAATLAETGRECRIYGMRRGIAEDQIEGNLRFRPFNTDAFIEDLRTSRAVVSGGGFTLLGESIYLHKPVLSVPLGNQYEQTLNARYLEREGVGLAAVHLEDPTIVKRFLEDLPRFEDRLAGYAQDGNREVLRAVDQHIDRAIAGVY